MIEMHAATQAADDAHRDYSSDSTRALSRKNCTNDNSC
jgi:hypothetical protein